ncbi:hypothetical protein BDY19DRAFT_155431 [Irpex rosettiformis]|uniref:Uncharacterized protein n=1 Tax=Irpex rosettiformis TaxID=378272 RepID=A0ACB8U4L3_9APHY|nr:hypothetical protein BDY19DRAFT_155431 [Irpex rosettiformis]
MSDLPTNTDAIHLPGSITPLRPSLGPANPSLTDIPTEGVSESSSSSHSHAGAIAGGVIGGVALLFLLIGAFLYYRHKRRAAPHPSRRRRGSEAIGDLRKPSGESFNGIDTLVGDDVFKAKRSGSYSSRIGKYESSSSIGHDRPSLGYEYDRTHTPSTVYGRRSLESTGETPTSGFAPALPTNAAFPDGRERSRSVSDQNQTQSRAAALAALHGDTAPTSWSQYPPMPPAPTSNRPDSVVGSGLARSESMTRAGNRSSRRANRKAVPKYDQEEFSSPSSPTYPPISPLDSARRSHDHDEIPSSSAESSNVNLHHQLEVAKSREDLLAAGYEVPELNHKSSFGNKAMHYLIPDPPPPQTD